MTRKIFCAIFLVSLAVLLAGLLIAAGCTYRYFGRVQGEQLRSEWRLAAAGIEESGMDYLTRLEDDGVRLTWIAADGTVRYDSEVEASQMENHADREEFGEALASGTGSSTRYSRTLTEQTVYYAARLSDGTVLRVSVSRETVFGIMAGAAPLLCVAACLAAALSWLLSARLARRIVMPLNRIDWDAPLENDIYEELSPLLVRIYRQHQQIKSQMFQLQKKQEEFTHITEHMKEGLILLDGNGCVLSMNPAAAAIFDVREDPVGKSFLTIERSSDMSEAAVAARSTGHTQIRRERHGRIWQFDFSRIEQGQEAAGLVVLAFDISEQERAERSRREFTANVSHELKTPLTSIIGSADLLDNNLVKPEDIPRFVGHIRKEATRLLNLIEDIIRLSQLDEGEQLAYETVDLAQIALEATEQLQDAAVQHRVALRLETIPCPLHSVARLLHEIVYNLTENAIKYNVPDGKVVITVSREEDEVCLQVMDTGIGIPAEYQDRVFERFYRVDKSHSKASGGTGLGLSIVKHAAQRLGARITLQSVPGRGTTVTVCFPR